MIFVIPDGSKPKPYPSAVQMAKNFAESVVRNAKEVVLEGEPLKVDESVTEARLNICHQCEWFDQGQNRCRNCGCAMQWKAMLKAEKCPIGKW